MSLTLAFDSINMNLSDESTWGNWLDDRVSSVCGQQQVILTLQNTILLALKGTVDNDLDAFVTLNYNLEIENSQFSGTLTDYRQ